MAKNTKAKINRTFKTHGIDLSGEIEIRDLESFNTRKEFNEWKEKAESFTNKNNLRYQFKKNKYGVSASKAFLNQIERDANRAIRLAKELTRKIEKIPSKNVGGMKQRILVAGRPETVTGISIPRKFNFNTIQSYRQLMDRAENMRKKTSMLYYDERNKTMQENYISMLEKSFHSDAKEVVDLIRQMNPDDFFDLYMQEFDLFDFDLFYTDDDFDMDDPNQGIIYAMKEYVEAYMSGKYNTDMKGFPNG